MPNYEAIVTNTTAQLHAAASEAYAAGVTTGDPFYAGVEALAQWLNGAEWSQLDRRLQVLIRDMQLTELVRTDSRRS